MVSRWGGGYSDQSHGKKKKPIAMTEINRSVCVSGFMEKGGRGLGDGENRTGGLE